MKKIKIIQRACGFTLVELLVVLGLFTIVFALSNISLTGLIARTSTQEFTQTVVSDLRRQQNRAMLGDTAAGISSAYGVMFGTTSYILFSGEIYVPAASDNTVVQLPTDLQFESITFPEQQLVFAKSSGELLPFSASSASASLRNTTDDTLVTLQFNQLGVVTITP